MPLRKTVMLSLMMFFQYAMWGAWTPILGGTVAQRFHATGAQIGSLYAPLWLACLITPFIAGQIVDRVMPSQLFVALAAAVCASAAWMMAHQATIGGMVSWMWVWSLAFAPTIGITNAIVFYHVDLHVRGEAEREKLFAWIRTVGTVGWIASGLLLTLYLQQVDASHGTVGLRPLEEMQIAALAGVLLTVLCALLVPNTPPARTGADPFAFAKAFRLFATVPGFTMFMAISFLISTEFQFYYTLNAPFLQDLGIAHTMVPATKTISQAAEIISLAFLLPMSLRIWGMKKTLLIGLFFWPIRYLIFALQQPLWLVVASLALHGIGFAFVFVTSYLYIDRVAPTDIRGSAQNLYTLITLGLGNWIGTLYSGWLKDHYTTGGHTNWPPVFLVPAALLVFCGLLLAATFKVPESRPDEPGELREAPADG